MSEPIAELPSSADLPPLASMRKIVVLRALQLGDLLCAVPALRSLRAAAPRAEITLIGLPWAAAFVRRYSHYLDRFLAFPGFPGMPERRMDVSAIPAFLSAVQLERANLAIQLHGSGEYSNTLVQLLGAARCAGYRPGDPGSSAAFTDDTGRLFLPWECDTHEITRCQRLMTFLGAAPQGDALTFPLTDADERLLQRSVCHLPAPGSYAIVHPGPRLATQRWPARRFAEVADMLADAGLDIVLTGTTEEAAVTASVADAMRAPALDLAGKTALGALGVLVRDARVVVSNDTGVSYLATALSTPSVVICYPQVGLSAGLRDTIRHFQRDFSSISPAATVTGMVMGPDGQGPP